MLEKIIRIISEYEAIDLEKIHGDSRLKEDLALDSFDMANLCCRIEEEVPLNIDPKVILEFITVADLADYYAQHQ